MFKRPITYIILVVILGGISISIWDGTSMSKLDRYRDQFEYAREEAYAAPRASLGRSVSELTALKNHVDDVSVPPWRNDAKTALMAAMTNVISGVRLFRDYADFEDVEVFMRRGDAELNAYDALR